MDLPTRIIEAVLFLADGPVDEASLAAHLPDAAALPAALEALQARYARSGLRLEQHKAGWALRTDPELAPYLERHKERAKTLSQAAMETLAIIAYHQPITRAEIERLRGVAVSKGTLDLLLDAGWVQPKGRRETPGRPVTWVTTADFLDHFDLPSLDDLPRKEELQQIGLLEGDADLDHALGGATLDDDGEQSDADGPERDDALSEAAADRRSGAS